MQALEEGKRRALLEQRDSARLAELDKQRLELRAHVLTLREGELDSRLRDRDRTIEDLNLRLRELAGFFRKEQAMRDLLSQRIAELQSARIPKRRLDCSMRSPSKPKPQKQQMRRRIAAKTTKSRKRGP